MPEEKKFDEKDLSSMIKIQLGIDIPEERLKEWDISKEEMKEILTQSTMLVFQFLLAYVKEKLSEKEKKEKDVPSTLYA